MKVSIITVAYNSAETIAECIQSVVNQTYSNIEYIVVDGSSTDGTQEIVRGFGDRVSVFKSEADNGIYDAMNKGLKLCTGEVVGILNSDDLYADNEVISDMVNLMQKTASDSCFSDLVYVDRKETNRIVRSWVSGEYTPERFLKGWMPPHPTFFLKRIYYDQFGLFDLSFNTSADYELMLRMLYKNKLSAAYLNRVTIKMRVGGQSNLSLRNRIKANIEDRRAWKVNNLKAPLFTTIRKPLSKIGQFFKKN